MTEGRVSRGDERVSFAPSNRREIALSHPREYPTRKLSTFHKRKLRAPELNRWVGLVPLESREHGLSGVGSGASALTWTVKN